MTRLNSGLGAACLMTALSGVLAASPVAGVAVADGLAQCAAIPVPDDRLACFDRLAATVAPGANPVLAARGAQGVDVRPPAIRKPSPEAVVAAISARIAQLVYSRSGGGSIILDNGQKWAIVGGDDYSRLGSGDLVTIRRGALGSYLMFAPSGRAFHVRRLSQ